MPRRRCTCSDVRPSRWQRSQQFLRVLAESLSWKGDRVALALFAHRAAPQLRLTRDPNALFFFFDHLGEQPPFPLENDTTWDTNIEEGLDWGLKLVDTDEALFGRSRNAQGVRASSPTARRGAARCSARSTRRASSAFSVHVVGVGTVDGRPDSRAGRRRRRGAAAEAARRARRACVARDRASRAAASTSRSGASRIATWRSALISSVRQRAPLQRRDDELRRSLLALPSSAPRCARAWLRCCCAGPRSLVAGRRRGRGARDSRGGGHVNGTALRRLLALLPVPAARAQVPTRATSSCSTGSSTARRARVRRELGALPRHAGCDQLVLRFRCRRSSVERSRMHVGQLLGFDVDDCYAFDVDETVTVTLTFATEYSSPFFSRGTSRAERARAVLGRDHAAPRRRGFRP